jgi:hypothetical protein
VRAVLERFHQDFGLSREWLSLHLARAEFLEKERGLVDQQAELRELLAGVRNLAATARALGGPKDVLACLNAWHYRVLAVVGEVGPSWYLTELTKLLSKMRRERGIARPRADVDARVTRHRYLRRDAERALVSSLGADAVAMLETAWLLPVQGDAESESDVVQEPAVALSFPRVRPRLPLRPELSEDVSSEVNARAARQFFVDLAKELRRNVKASRARRS